MSKISKEREIFLRKKYAADKIKRHELIELLEGVGMGADDIGRRVAIEFKEYKEHQLL